MLLHSMLNPSSEQANKIYRLFNYFNVAALGIFILVTAVNCLHLHKIQAEKK